MKGGDAINPRHSRACRGKSGRPDLRQILILRDSGRPELRVPSTPYTRSASKAWTPGIVPGMTKSEHMSENNKITPAGERIAKVMARAGLASRREAEAWIAAGRVAVNGAVISSPALNVTPADRIVVDGQALRARERSRLFRYHKPRGLVTTHADPEGRPTIFRALPKGLPRLISVGRLDINTEGLLLVTNDGGLARVLELPATGWLRRYRVRALGRVMQPALDRLRAGITVAGMHYGPIEATLDREQGANVWLTLGIREGKNREVRKVLETLGLKVNRLIRVAFGPFELGELDDGAVEEVKTAELRAALGPQIAAQAEVDFDAPLIEHDDQSVSPGHSGAGRRPEPGIQKQARSLRLDSGFGAKAPSRNDKKKKRQRRDRSGGPRPARPRSK
jgi:23S rRNA pseudouridine2605 synthase